jgi:hypothetical protein
VETLAPNKFLLGVTHEDHLDRILRFGPWNVKGSLLLLQQWSPDLAIAEVELTQCLFWVQVHGLPRQNMTTNNVIKIGKGLGTLMEVENFETPGLICRQYLRFRVDLNTAQPLIPRFHLPRPENEPLWISFRYERLGDYCTIYGLIRHKRNNCSNHSHALPHINYHIPLQATGSLGPRMSFAREDSDSGMSFEGPASSRSEATSGFSHGGESSHMQIVPRLSHSYIICHVLSPPDLSSENSSNCTRVEDLGLRH